MSVFQKIIQVRTPGRGALSITREAAACIRESGIRTGVCHLFVQHTSASLMICENADPDVQRDLEGFMQRIAPDGDPAYAHAQEGADDMPAHIRALLTGMDLSIPVTDGGPNLGVWQGLYLWEHRYQPHHRQVALTVLGER